MPGQNRRDNGACGAIWHAEGADRSARTLLTSSDGYPSRHEQQGFLHQLVAGGMRLKPLAGKPLSFGYLFASHLLFDNVFALLRIRISLGRCK